jgi:hypothetical protein
LVSACRTRAQASWIIKRIAGDTSFAVCLTTHTSEAGAKARCKLTHWAYQCSIGFADITYAIWKAWLAVNVATGTVTC